MLIVYIHLLKSIYSFHISHVTYMHTKKRKKNAYT